MINKAWRTIAITFMVIFVIETIFIGYIFFVGLDMIDKETDCQVGCYNLEDVMSYSYDDYTNICECYNGAGDIMHRSRIK